ncbi:MAG: DUF4404 family protein [Steroidobacteraceae bacterium]
MDPDILRDQLTKLHEELANVRHVDPRSNQLMVEVLQDIQRLLEQQHATEAPPTEPSPPANASLPERLEKVAVQFEADHPTLAASSRRLIDLLGKAGL